MDDLLLECLGQIGTVTVTYDHGVLILEGRVCFMNLLTFHACSPGQGCLLELYLNVLVTFGFWLACQGAPSAGTEGYSLPPRTVNDLEHDLSRAVIPSS